MNRTTAEHATLGSRRWHAPAWTSSRRAHYLREPGTRVVKAVLLMADGKPLLALVPATQRVGIERLRELLGVSSLQNATISDIAVTFPDAEYGATPAFGRAYGVPIVIDERLFAEPRLLFPSKLQCAAVEMDPEAFCVDQQPVRLDFAAASTSGAEPESPYRPHLFEHKRAGERRD